MDKYLPVSQHAYEYLLERLLCGGYVAMDIYSEDGSFIEQINVVKKFEGSDIPAYREVGGQRYIREDVYDKYIDNETARKMITASSIFKKVE